MAVHESGTADCTNFIIHDDHEANAGLAEEKVKQHWLGHPLA